MLLYLPYHSEVVGSQIKYGLDRLLLHHSERKVKLMEHLMTCIGIQPKTTHLIKDKRVSSANNTIFLYSFIELCIYFPPKIQKLKKPPKSIRKGPTCIYYHNLKNKLCWTGDLSRVCSAFALWELGLAPATPAAPNGKSCKENGWMDGFRSVLHF